MLGKLLKHEWKAVWKVPTLLIGVLLAIALTAALTFALPIWDSDWIGLPLSGLMLLLLFYFAMIGVGIGISIYFAVRYYKNMFTEEGYLTHTLPVTARQILLNKVIIMSVWNLLAGVAVIASLLVFVGVAGLLLACREGIYAADILKAAAEIREIFRSGWFDESYAFLLSILCLALVSAVSGALTVISAITLGQMVRRHRILGSIGAYFAINTVIQGIGMMMILPWMFKMVTDDIFLHHFEQSMFSFYTISYLSMTVVNLIAAAGLYFLSEYLLCRQLELE